MRALIKKIVIAALVLEARLVLARTKPKVIAVTGSVGKTSAKDLLYTVVSSTFSAKKNEKSLNSEFGVPLTILGLKTAWSSPMGWLLNLGFGIWRLGFPGEKYKFLVLELGADKPGDIKTLSSWVRPKLGVITGIGSEVPVHVEFFRDIEALVSEKSELLRALPEDGTAIVNRDDARAWEMREATRARVISYGFASDANIRGDNLHTSYDDPLDSARGKKPKGINLRVDYAGKSVPVRLCGVLGKGHAYAALAAFAVGANLGINVVTISDALGRHKFTPGRLRILPGKNGSTIIEDTYNSSPSAVKLALETLHELELTVSPMADSQPQPRKVAVLGDMLELGEYSEGEHRKVGTWIRGVADVLVCVGEKAKWIGESAIEDGFDKGSVHEFGNSQEAGKFLSSFVLSGDMVLLKASQSVRLERATEQLLEDPTKASELLVRQEKERRRKM